VTKSALTEEMVLEILPMLDRGISQKAIADYYGVSKKTISRINTGKTWSELSKRTKTLPVHNVALPPVSSPNLLLDLLDETTSIKNHFGLSFDEPIDWGYFNWYDGVHSIATDGIIAWESSDLTNFALKLAASNVLGAPIWSQDARELPTLRLKNLMTQPIGGRYIADSDAGSVVRLVAEDGNVVLLGKKYYDIANKMRFDIRQAGNLSNVVYLSRAKTKTTSDTSSVAMAAVAVIGE
jgi:hypothetical protein